MRSPSPLDLLKQRSSSAQKLFLAAVVLVVVPKEIAALFGFGGSSQASSKADAAARARVVEQIRAKVAADDYVPPAVGVGRRDAARYTEAQAKGQLTCPTDGDNSSIVMMIDWAMVNDDFCDCPLDGSDEPGTASCSRGSWCSLLSWYYEPVLYCLLLCWSKACAVLFGLTVVPSCFDAYI